MASQYEGGKEERIKNSPIGGKIKYLRQDQKYAIPSGITTVDHGMLTGLTDDDHTQYYNSTRHTVAVHDALNINADRLDEYHAAQLLPVGNTGYIQWKSGTGILGGDEHLWWDNGLDTLYTSKFIASSTANIKGTLTLGDLVGGVLKIYEVAGPPVWATTFRTQTQTTDITYYLPAAQGGAGTLLQNNGAGYLSWAGGVGGSDTQVQFNDGGVFGGDSELTWNKANDVLYAKNIKVKGPWADVKAFGATGNGTTNDYAAVQAALDYGRTNGIPVYFPPGNYLVLSTPYTYGQFTIFGSGPQSRIRTTANIPLLEIKVDLGEVYFGQIHDLAFCDDGTGTRTNNAGIRISGTTTNRFNYTAFRDLWFLGTYTGIDFTKITNVAGEAHLDWNSFSNIKMTGNGGNNTNYGFHFVNGSGTGNAFTNLNLVTTVVGIFFDSQNGANVGDIVIGNLQCGGAGTGVKGLSTAAYRSNISIMDSQFNAGITTGVDFQNYNDIKLIGNNYAGIGYMNILTGSTNIIEFPVAYGDTGLKLGGSIRLKNNQQIGQEDSGGTVRTLIKSDGANNLYIGYGGQANINIGYGSTSANPLSIPVGSAGTQKQVLMGDADSGGTGFRLLRVPN